ncbi:MAG TPA: hypothetical protein VKA08_06940 [Balneolales bacterium]|nr:hypothetical protein [Balneolales bacterium]
MKHIIWLAEAGCKIKIYGPGESNGGDQPPQTRILKAYATPSTVAPGDTAQFVCVIADSTNTKFRFYWYIYHGTPIDGTDTTYGGDGVYMTLGNQIKWKATSQPDSYSFEITVDDGSKDSIWVNGVFDVTVKQ